MTVTLWSAWALGLAVLAVQPGRLAAQDKAADKCVFEGTARNSVTRLAVAKATIRLIPANGPVGYTGSSNAAGGFHFEAIASGDYEVEAERAGYIPKWVLSDASGRAISNLHCDAGQKLSGNDLWFTPQATVSGKVIGPDGEPLREARIFLFERKWRRGKRDYTAAYSETADDQGQYRLTGVEPGGYIVYAARPQRGPLAYGIKEAPDKPEMRIAARYHPNAAQLEGASALEVKGGDAITGIDFKLPLAAVFHLRGKTDPPSALEDTGVRLTPQYKGQALDWAAENAAIAPDGSFEIDGVTPGEYLLYTFQSGEHDRLVGAKVPVTVTAQDSAGVVASPVRRFELHGHVRVEGRAAGEAIPVQIFCEGGDADEYSSLMRGARPKADGTFSISDLTPDRYTIRIANVETGKDGGLYLKSVRVNGVSAPGGEIDLADGEAQDVELVLCPSVGSVEGTVSGADGASDHGVPEPHEDLTVVIVPEKVDSGDSRTQTAFLDPDGRFRVTDLEPGSYRLFAVTKYDAGLWQSAEFRKQIAGRGVPVAVSEKGSARAEVPLVRAAEVRAVEARIE